MLPISTDIELDSIYRPPAVRCLLNLFSLSVKPRQTCPPSAAPQCRQSSAFQVSTQPCT